MGYAGAAERVREKRKRRPRAGLSLQKCRCALRGAVTRSKLSVRDHQVMPHWPQTPEEPGVGTWLRRRVCARRGLGSVALQTGLAFLSDRAYPGPNTRFSYIPASHILSSLYIIPHCRHSASLPPGRLAPGLKSPLALHSLLSFCLPRPKRIRALCHPPHPLSTTPPHLPPCYCWGLMLLPLFPGTHKPLLHIPNLRRLESAILAPHHASLKSFGGAPVLKATLLCGNVVPH